jgi:hypothetical protein
MGWPQAQVRPRVVDDDADGARLAARASWDARSATARFVNLQHVNG